MTPYRAASMHREADRVDIFLLFVFVVPYQCYIRSSRNSSFLSATTSTLLTKLHPISKMDYAYDLLDKGYIPDAALRPVIRQLCRKRLREINHGMCPSAAPSLSSPPTTLP